MCESGRKMTRLLLQDEGSVSATGGDGHAMQQLLVPYEAIKINTVS